MDRSKSVLSSSPLSLHYFYLCSITLHSPNYRSTGTYCSSPKPGHYKCLGSSRRKTSGRLEVGNLFNDESGDSIHRDSTHSSSVGRPVPTTTHLHRTTTSSSVIPVDLGGPYSRNLNFVSGIVVDSSNRVQVP